MTARQPPPDPPKGKPRAGAHAPYDVGYGKPPEHSRFRLGKSGNPKGRPRLRRNLKNIVGDALSEEITIREGERQRRTSRLDALVRTVLNKALQGDAKVIPHLIGLIRLAGLAGDEPEAAEGATPIRTEDEALIRDFLRRFGGRSAETADNSDDDRAGNQSLRDKK